MEQRPGVGFFKGRAHNGVAPVHCLQIVIRLFCLAHVVQKNFPWTNSFSISQPDVTDIYDSTELNPSGELAHFVQILQEYAEKKFKGTHKRSGEGVVWSGPTPKHFSKLSSGPWANEQKNAPREGSLPKSRRNIGAQSKNMKDTRKK